VTVDVAARRDSEDITWVPHEQPEKRAFLCTHDGDVALYVRCDDCGLTTRTTAATHLFVPCSSCDGEISVRWVLGLA